ncbi:ATP-binding protein [Limibacter armeniacum]|uniref:sensor histidine kinase n=1 Tax=Limibacter armeniacum TaxID=466084 RepID=UPI002FE5B102
MKLRTLKILKENREEIIVEWANTQLNSYDEDASMDIRQQFEKDSEELLDLIIETFSQPNGKEKIYEQMRGVILKITRQRINMGLPIQEASYFMFSLKNILIYYLEEEYQQNPGLWLDEIRAINELTDHLGTAAINTFVKEKPLRELSKQNERLKELNGRLFEKEDHLREVNKQLTELVARLSNQNKELNDFARIVSHELKSPLNVIFMATGMMESFHKDILTGEVGEMYVMIKDAAERMKKMIYDLLDYAKSAVHEDVTELLDLNSVIDEVLPVLPVDETVKLNIENLPEVKFDRTALTQVIRNLLSNAIKYGDKELTVINIAAEEQEQYTVLKIEDNGSGIDKKHFNDIFELFKTLGKEAKKGSSTGLGLPLVKRIINRNRGKIKLESELGVGTTFYISFLKKR